jgi:hypothetical protein
VAVEVKRIKWSGWEKFPKARGAARVCAPEGAVCFEREIDARKIVAAARSLGLTLSDETHPERRRVLQVFDGATLVATVRDFNKIELPAERGARKKGVDFVNALLH